MYHWKKQNINFLVTIAYLMKTILHIVSGYIETSQMFIFCNDPHMSLLVSIWCEKIEIHLF